MVRRVEQASLVETFLPIGTIRWETENYRVTVRTCCQGWDPVYNKCVDPQTSKLWLLFNYVGYFESFWIFQVRGSHLSSFRPGSSQPSECLPRCPGGWAYDFWFAFSHFHTFPYSHFHIYSCVNGNCTSPSSCSCYTGWTGPHCTQLCRLMMIVDMGGRWWLNVKVNVKMPSFHF